MIKNDNVKFLVVAFLILGSMFTEWAKNNPTWRGLGVAVAAGLALFTDPKGIVLLRRLFGSEEKITTGADFKVSDIKVKIEPKAEPRKTLSELLQIDRSNFELINDVKRELIENQDYLKECVEKYPLEVCFGEYRTVLFGEKELINLIEMLSSKLDSFTKSQKKEGSEINDEFVLFDVCEDNHYCGKVALCLAWTESDILVELRSKNYPLSREENKVAIFNGWPSDQYFTIKWGDSVFTFSSMKVGVDETVVAHVCEGKDARGLPSG